jgi:hypothetical protein
LPAFCFLPLVCPMRPASISFNFFKTKSACSHRIPGRPAEGPRLALPMPGLLLPSPSLLGALRHQIQPGRVQLGDKTGAGRPCAHPARPVVLEPGV